MNDQEINEFKELVVEYVKLDDIIRKKNDELKNFKKDKKDIEQYILESMEKLDENVIDISDGKLRLNSTKTKSTLKENHIQEALKTLIKDETQAKNMTKYIMETRKIVERKNIKRTFTRKN